MRSLVVGSALVICLACSGTTGGDDGALVVALVQTNLAAGAPGQLVATNHSGGTLTFNAGLCGAPVEQLLGDQWQATGSPNPVCPDDVVSGSDGAQITFTFIAPTAAGTYRIVVIGTPTDGAAPLAAPTAAFIVQAADGGDTTTTGQRRSGASAAITPP